MPNDAQLQNRRQGGKARFLIPDDVEILDNGATFRAGEDALDYLHYHLREVEDGRRYEHYKAVCLNWLASLPNETRSDTARLEKTGQVLAGFNKLNLQVDFIHLMLGVFEPKPLGIVQVYGVACTAPDLQQAVDNARLAMTVLRDNFRGAFRQIQFQPLDNDLVAWLNRAFHCFPFAVSVVGHPDPREEDSAHTQRSRPAAGGQRQPSRSPYSEQQNETFARVLAAGNHEFMAQVLATPLPTEDLSQLLVGVLDDASSWRSRSQGTKAINVGIALPIALSGGVARSAQTGYGVNFGRNYGYGLSDSLTQGHSHGTTDTTGTSHSVGIGHGYGVAQTESWGTSHSTAQGASQAVSAGQSLGVSDAVSQGHSTSTTLTDGHNLSKGESHSGFSSETQSFADPMTTLVNALPNVNVGGNAGVNAQASGSVTENALVASSTQSLALGGSLGVNGGLAANPAAILYDGLHALQGQAIPTGTSVVSGGSSGTSSSEGWSNSISHGVSDSLSVSHGLSQGWSSGLSAGVSSSVGDTVSHGTALSRSENWNTSESWGTSASHSVSDSDSIAHGLGRSVMAGQSSGIGATQGLGMGNSLGGSFGIVPSIGASKSYQWQDEAAQTVADLLETQAQLLRRAVMTGGWLTEYTILTATPEATGVIEVAVRQAYAGMEDTVSAIQARYLSSAEQQYKRLHAACFTPSTMRETIPGLVEAQRHATLQDNLMVSTLVSPAMLLHGAGQMGLEKFPDFTTQPLMAKADSGAKALLGYQYSTETGELTRFPVFLSEQRHTHTLFQGDTGSGKSELGYRVAYECWGTFRHRVIVLEFGQGWSRFINSQIPRASFELYQLQPDSARPLRWPILTIPRLINPEWYVTALCEVIANAGKLGPVQVGILQTTLRTLYIQYGVLLAEDEVLKRDEFATVSAVEADRLGLPVGLRVESLTADQVQRLAVFRSRKVSLKTWIDMIEAGKADKTVSERERQAIATLLFRLRQLTFGQARQMFGALADDEDAVAIEDLGMPKRPGERPGFVVIEGGDRLRPFPRALLLGLLAVIIYNSAKIRYAQAGGRAPFATDVFWEEAQKVLTGDDEQGGSSEGGSQTSTIETFTEMWRDGRRYRMYQHPLVQNLAQLPDGIVPSCNNGFFFRSKNEKDHKVILSYINRSPSGFVDQDYQRFLPRMTTGMCIAKIGGGSEQQIQDMEPVLMRPLRVPMLAPSDQELRDYYNTLPALRKDDKS